MVGLFLEGEKKIGICQNTKNSFLHISDENAICGFIKFRSLVFNKQIHGFWKNVAALHPLVTGLCLKLFLNFVFRYYLFLCSGSASKNVILNLSFFIYFFISLFNLCSFTLALLCALFQWLHNNLQIKTIYWNVHHML